MAVHLDQLSAEARKRIAERNPATITPALVTGRRRTTRREVPAAECAGQTYRCPTCAATFTRYPPLGKGDGCPHPRIEVVLNGAKAPRQANPTAG